MSGEGLPQGLGGLFRDGGAGRRLDVDLPPGRLVTPSEPERAKGAGEPGAAYWFSDGPVAPDLWGRLRRAHAQSGLWPVLASSDSADVPWAAGDVSPQPVAAIDALDPGSVLAGLWRDWVEDLGAGEDLPELAPFGRDWPGLAPATGGEDSEGPDPDTFTDQYVLDHDDGTSRLLLVAADRSADVITVAGWQGPLNHTDDMAALSAVLRSWEDRFGIRVIELSLDVLVATVARPPATMAEAERVAAEHFSFCPDNIVQGIDTITAYAASIRAEDIWSFWWD